MKFTRNIKDKTYDMKSTRLNLRDEIYKIKSTRLNLQE